MNNNNSDDNTSTLPLTAVSYVICGYEFDTFEELLTFKILKCYVNPIISILGFCTNIVSIHMLRHSGLKKTSNILLLGLTVSDMMCQLMSMNYALILDFFGPNRKNLVHCGYQYGDALDYFLLASVSVVYFLGQWGQYVSSAIPCLITLERCLAVFTPLTFKRIITPKTATAAVIAAYVFWMPIPLFYMSLFEVQNVYRLGIRVLRLVAGKRFAKFLSVYADVYNYVGVALGTWTPIVFVSLGCILIGINVKLPYGREKKCPSPPVRFSGQ